VIALAALALWAQAPPAGDGRGKGKAGAAGDAKGGRAGGDKAAETKALAPPPDPQVLRFVRPDVYLITGEGGNSVFRVTPEGVILVDTKTAKRGNYERLVEHIRGITPQPVKVVLNTNSQPDHAGNNERFQMAGAQIVSGDPGTSAVVIFAAPHAHTGNDSAFFFPADRVIAIGDLIAVNRPPVVNYTSGGSLTGIAQALDGILGLAWDVAIPGHGDPMNHAGVEAYRTKLKTLIDRAHDAVKRGVAKEQLVAQIKADDLGWQLRLDAAQLEGFYAEMSGAR
jgi:glyoxylase-like metal-dependent hydrolase (beta-lactamase superfamily II)